MSFRTGVSRSIVSAMEIFLSWKERQQDQVNNANSAFILIYRLISRGCQIGLIGPGGPGGPGGQGGQGSQGGQGGQGGQGRVFRVVLVP